MNIEIIQAATSTLPSDGDNRRGSLGTIISNYDGLDGSTQIDVTENGARTKVAIRMISRVWSSV